ncbi:MAG: peptidylprolyl isomerase [Nitratireductor sp.]|nr:peptidylprolyl isomerase [Nitratireductor sp.]
MIKFLNKQAFAGTTAILLAMSVVLAGCNTSTKAVESAAEEQQSQTASAEGTATDGQQAAAKPDESGVKIIREAPKVSQKGTTIRAVVNGEPITSYDVSRRAAFLKLRRAKSSSSQAALEEMVDQVLKLQEAKRTSSLAGDAEVNAAFANFAKGNKLTLSQMSTVMEKSGVGTSHFKEFIRTQMSWNTVVQKRFRYESSNNVQQDALFNLRKSGADKPETVEYRLQQVVFVIPTDKRSSSTISRRRQEALAFRQQFTSCSNTKQSSVGLLDVTVRDLPRLLEEQLPSEWMEEVKRTASGATTDVKTTDKGVEFLAVCDRRNVSDDKVAEVLSQKEQFDSFNKEASELSDKYLKDVKSQSSIIYR